MVLSVLTTTGRPQHWTSDAFFPSVDLYITGRCNRRCSYCFLPREYLESRVLMPDELFEHALDWATARDTEEITLLGGEPSLHPRFTSWLDLIASRNLRCRIVTNGAQQFQRAVDEGSVSASNVERVAVSLDTVEAEVQDRLRGPRAHADAFATVAILHKAEIPFDINSTATRSVLPSLKELLKFADDVGARRLNVHWPSTIGLGTDLEEAERPLEHEWLAAIAEVEAFRPRTEMFIEIERGFLSSAPFKGCALTAPTNIQIFPDGRAILCGLGTDRDDWPALRLGPSGLESLPGVSIERQLEQRIRSNCSSCPAVDEPGRACIYDKISTQRDPGC